MQRGRGLSLPLAGGDLRDELRQPRGREVQRLPCSALMYAVMRSSRSRAISNCAPDPRGETRWTQCRFSASYPYATASSATTGMSPSSAFCFSTRSSPAECRLYLATEEQVEARVERVPGHRVFRSEQLGRQTKSGADETPGCGGFTDDPLAIGGFELDHHARVVLGRMVGVVDLRSHRRGESGRVLGALHLRLLMCAETRMGRSASRPASGAVRVADEQDRVAHHVIEHAAALERPCQNHGACGPLCSSAARARYGRPVTRAPRAQRIAWPRWICGANTWFSRYPWLQAHRFTSSRTRVASATVRRAASRRRCRSTAARRGRRH